MSMSMSISVSISIAITITISMTVTIVITMTMMTIILIKAFSGWSRASIAVSHKHRGTPYGAVTGAQGHAIFANKVSLRFY